MTERIFKLCLSTENDAFEDERLPYEVARILRHAADCIEAEGVDFPAKTLFDANGNDVGRYALKTRRQWQ